MEVPGKVTVITGASAGIGCATAKRFAAEGAKVVLAARSADKLTALALELRKQGHEALAVPTDMRDRIAISNLVQKAFTRFGRIDIFINNAGQAASGTVAELNPAHFHAILTLNVFGPLYAIQDVAHKMRMKGGGLIINISSMVSKMHIPGLGGYAATKSALNMLSETARIELASDNIRVITVYPRLTATDFGKNTLGGQPLRQRHGEGEPVIDSADFVAGKILEAAQKEVAEQFMDS
jgi:short-subunit dehydrogenase